MDDVGQQGGLSHDTDFVIAGDLNADPLDGDSTNRAIHQLLEHPLIRDTKPQSKGGVEAAQVQGKVNATHKGKPAMDTGDFSDRSPGNLRIDYVLPARTLKISSHGVFWPTAKEPSAKWITGSDPRLVWLDIKVK